MTTEHGERQSQTCAIASLGTERVLYAPLRSSAEQAGAHRSDAINRKNGRKTCLHRDELQTSEVKDSPSPMEWAASHLPWRFRIHSNRNAHTLRCKCQATFATDPALSGAPFLRFCRERGTGAHSTHDDGIRTIRRKTTSFLRFVFFIGISHSTPERIQINKDFHFHFIHRNFGNAFMTEAIKKIKKIIKKIKNNDK